MAEFIEDMEYIAPNPKRLKDIPTVVEDLMSIVDRAFRDDRYGYLVIRAIKEKKDKIQYTIKEVIQYPKDPQYLLSLYIIDFFNNKKTNDDLFIYERINRKRDELTNPYSNYIESDRSQTIRVKEVTEHRIRSAKNYEYILEQLD